MRECPFALEANWVERESYRCHKTREIVLLVWCLAACGCRQAIGPAGVLLPYVAPGGRWRTARR